MTQMGDNRCFGRLKARELTGEELALVGGGLDPNPDEFHSGFCQRSVSGGGMEEPCHTGCTYTI